VRWHNAVVVDIESGEQWPLLDRRGVLSRLWMRLARPEDGPARSSALVFAATVEDSNGDGLLNDLDARRALLTDGAGRTPRYVSPAGTQLRDVHFHPELDRAILMVASDSNGDGVFSDEEPAEPYALSLQGDTPALPLVSSESREAVEGLLERPAN